ncbi:MAG: hypothetical protein M1816_001374 [Peltula sp. TS41687]|nr:MAG: hypothetical protein M1816_001374 [Peltula sp. TS41687]
MTTEQPTYEEILRELADAKEREKGLLHELLVRRFEANQDQKGLQHQLRRLPLLEALELWHQLFSSPHIRYHKGDPAKLYTGTTSAKKRLYPKYLRHWSDFQSRQKAAFDEIARVFEGPGEKKRFSMAQAYRDEASRFMPRLVLRNEPDLEVYQTCTVEHYVADIWARNPARSLGTLEFQKRPGHALEDLTERLEELAVEDPDSDDPEPSTPLQRRALDEICTLEVDGKTRNLFAVEYKAADILTPYLLSQGLRDLELVSIINRIKASTDTEGKTRELAEEEVAKIVTQVYDYMIDKGVTYGYATGGQAFLFLFFDPADVHTLYYECVVPADAVGRDNDVSQTAIGLVASFARLAREGLAFDAKWSKETRKRLPTWMVDDATKMSQITPSPARPLKSSPTYKGKGKPTTDGSERLLRSKTARQRELAATCKPTQDDAPQPRRQDTPSDDGDHGTLDPPPTTSHAQSTFGTTGSRQGKVTASEGSSDGGQQQQRAYCTTQCLLSLVRGLPLDERCPNVEAHRQLGSGRHALDRDGLRQLVEEQLFHDDDDAGFESLDRSGWAGALFRVTLLSHGYTFVGKGTVAPLVRVLRKEAHMYSRLDSIQGTAVPVYLGSVDLARIFWLTCSVPIEHVLLMSWGGEEAWQLEQDGVMLARETRRTIKEVQQLGVYQCDVREPNLLWNEELGRVLLIDFERAKVKETDKEGKVGRQVVGKEKRALREIDGNEEVVRGKKGRKVEAVVAEGEAQG